MIEKRGNIWDHHRQGARVVVVTTNGMVAPSGLAVMGAGVALEAVKRVPDIRRQLGGFLRERGNHCNWLDECRILSFPTKHHWRAKSDIRLIGQSARELDEIARVYKHTVFVMPRPGCGCGGLQWENVRPEIEFLPDNVWVLHNGI